MRAYFWLWLVFSLTDAIIFFAQKSPKFLRSLYVILKSREKLVGTLHSFFIDVT